MRLPHNAKIVTLDIETAPMVAFVWGLWKQNVGLNQIHADWSILSYSGKWLHEKRTFYQDNRGKGPSLTEQDKGVRDDLELLHGLWDLLDTADVVVMQNGQKFDKRKIYARFLTCGMAPPSPFQIVDTMLEAKKVAAFTSNRLAWLSELLTDTPKSEHKKFPGFELWTECLKDNPQAWKEMEQYNRIDVKSTEKLYLALRPYMENHPNLGSYVVGAEEDDRICPVCGSADTSSRGYRTLKGGLTYRLYHCNSCGRWSRGRYAVNSKQQRRNLLGG